jgi:hypothetical protein
MLWLVSVVLIFMCTEFLTNEIVLIPLAGTVIIFKCEALPCGCEALLVVLSAVYDEIELCKASDVLLGRALALDINLGVDIVLDLDIALVLGPALALNIGLEVDLILDLDITLAFGRGPTHGAAASALRRSETKVFGVSALLYRRHPLVMRSEGGMQGLFEFSSLTVAHKWRNVLATFAYRGVGVSGVANFGTFQDGLGNVLGGAPGDDEGRR